MFRIKNQIMRILQALVFSLLATQADCQLSEVTYDVETNDTLSVKYYNTDRAEWQVEDNSITWIWYDADSNLLLKEQYAIVASEATETGFIWSYTVKSKSGSQIIIELWIFEDGSKAVSHRYADGIVRYSGNVSF